MQTYLDLVNYVLTNGTLKSNRTGIKTISCFGYQSRYSLQKGFPLLTTKQMYTKAIVHELLWFIKGDTNIKYLVDNDVRIWNEWAFEKYKQSPDYQKENMDEYIAKIKNSSSFAKQHANLGPVYGKQWRNFNGVDQLKELVQNLRQNPDSRRLIISAWNPADISKMALPPCHCFMQFYVSDNKLSCQLYQRSADIFLGVPFNIASYSLLTCMLAQVCDLIPHEFIHTIGDAHIYENHFQQVKEQLSRKPLPLCQLKLNPNVKSIFDFKYEDIEFVDYQSHPTIKAKVAV